MRSAIIVLVLFAIPAFAHSAVIEVPKDYTTIQAAIDAAVKGDTVLVAPGTYVENIDFKGKAITVTSSGGAAVTIIDGNQYGSVVIFENNEDSNSILEGFSLINGSGVYFTPYVTYGGGIYCSYTFPTIMSNMITKNTADYGGGIACYCSSPTIMNNTIIENKARFCGGIFCKDTSSPTITNNEISRNTAGDLYNFSGGGIFCKDFSSPTITNNVIWKNTTGCNGGGIGCETSSSPTITNNIIIGNETEISGGGIFCIGSSSPTITNNTISGNLVKSDTYGDGGGIYCGIHSSPTIMNNTISGNSLKTLFSMCGGGGICCKNYSSPTITNNTIAGNEAGASGGGIYCDNSSPTMTNTILWDNDPNEIYGDPLVSFSDVKGGWPGTGNIDSNPLFVDPANNDYHLTFNSPCRGSGDNTAVIKPFDFEGDPRIACGTVDMGADEFYTHLYHTGEATPGGNIEVKFIDLPGTSPVILWVGSGVLGAPINTKYGDWYLQLPALLEMNIGSIATPSGVTVLPYTFDPNFPVMNIPMQALIGKNLTNLCVMKVK